MFVENIGNTAPGVHGKGFEALSTVLLPMKPDGETGLTGK
jgi:hypothetical protein